VISVVSPLRHYRVALARAPYPPIRRQLGNARNGLSSSTSRSRRPTPDLSYERVVGRNPEWVILVP
jgi:hypothetical protein